jgi:DNA repair ATPase RecN
MAQCPIESKRAEIEADHNYKCDQTETLEQIFADMVKQGESISQIAAIYGLRAKPLRAWLIRKRIVKTHMRRVVTRRSLRNTGLSRMAEYSRRLSGIPANAPKMDRSTQARLAALSRHDPHKAQQLRRDFFGGTI